MATNSTISRELIDHLRAAYTQPEDPLGEERLFEQLKKALIAPDRR